MLRGWVVPAFFFLCKKYRPTSEERGWPCQCAKNKKYEYKNTIVK